MLYWSYGVGRSRGTEIVWDGSSTARPARLTVTIRHRGRDIQMSGSGVRTSYEDSSRAMPAM